ncbi:tripartite tricarboxylate transporter TctB family protein [Rhodospirillum sp. A1_3_36]|uniref:tripartite tricarboxylate transporter TctB family protein n=1 Tax=Rhodospirillum sp. A1_3_36 TaxID=3391666 RepID=UPI0039A47730
MRLSRDMLTALLLLISGLVMFLVARGYPTPAGLEYGAGFFPKLVASGLMLSGGLVLFSRPRRDRACAIRIDWPLAGRCGQLVGLIVLYGLVLDFVGFHLATFPLLVLASRLFGGRWGPACALAAFATIGLHLLFYSVMRVTLPWGFLESFAW